MLVTYLTTREKTEIQKQFEAYGKVESVSIVMDKGSGRSKGFGFVEMPDKGEAEAAITALNGKVMDGRPLTVNEARPRAESTNRGRSSNY